MTTNINSILKSISTIDNYKIVYEDEDSVFVKVKAGEVLFVLTIDTTKSDEDIRDFVMLEVVDAIARHIRIHG